MLGRLVLAAVASTLISPGTLLAGGFPQVLDFGQQCLPGAFKSCASVSIWTWQGTYSYSDGEEYTRTFIEVNFANLQGILPPDVAGDGPRYIEGLELKNLFVNPDVFYEPEATFFGWYDRSEFCTLLGSSGRNCPEFNSDHWRPNTIEMTLFTNSTALAGCDHPDPAPPDIENAWGWTCGGSVRWRFNVIGDVRLTKESAMLLEFSDGMGHGASCVTGIDCVRVPEPASLLLVASGLLGIAGVGARRTKRETRP